MRIFITWPGILATLLLALGAITLSIKAGDILSKVAATAAVFNGSTTTLFLTPYDDTDLEIGETERVDVNINTKASINALGVTIKFPVDLLEVVGFSKEKSFLDLWTEDTAIREDIGEIHFSGGTVKKGGLTGTGTVLTVLVKSKRAGIATLSFVDTEVYPNDGSGRVMYDETRSLSFDIADPKASNASHAQDLSTQPPSIIAPTEMPRPRTADVNTDGAINLVDVSIMVMRLVMPYDYHFDINMDGSITVADVSAVLAQSR